jgi:hypothetical protein
MSPPNHVLAIYEQRYYHLPSHPPKPLLSHARDFRSFEFIIYGVSSAGYFQSNGFAEVSVKSIKKTQQWFMNSGILKN